MSTLVQNESTDGFLEAVTPKMFYSKMTGQGMKGGLLNRGLNPGNLPRNTPENLTARPLDHKHTQRSGDLTRRFLPMNPLLETSFIADAGMSIQLLDLSDDEIIDVENISTDPEVKNKLTGKGDTLRVGELTIGGSNGSARVMTLYVRLLPQSSVVNEEGTKAEDRTISVRYRIEMFFISDESHEWAQIVNNVLLMSSDIKNAVIIGYSNNPLKTMQTFLTHMFGMDVNIQLDVWMKHYSTYAQIEKAANLWVMGDMGKMVGNIIDEFGGIAARDEDSIESLALVSRMSNQLAFIETYSVPLDAYKYIYERVIANFGHRADIVSALSASNLNMLMINQLNRLESVADRVPRPFKTDADGNPIILHEPDGKFSTQQREAILTNEPFVIVQAGAGAGKTTTLMARNEVMITHDIPAKDITVLSFTNAAADNVTARVNKLIAEKGTVNAADLATELPNAAGLTLPYALPAETPNGIKSMTIAKMILDIYMLNFPTHELSSHLTLANCLRIAYRNNDVIEKFVKLLIDAEENRERNSFTLLNAFVERNIQFIITALNRVRQTTLALTQILCYQLIDNLHEPESLKSKYLIIDEVQDNSIFEFIYVLKYVAKHAMNLYIVGDASQTLYEFRNSNPKALNALESSGVFATYRLTTNYRSKQEILDFANVLLKNIEANQFAKIQLQADENVESNIETFKERVQLNYKLVPKITDFPKQLGKVLIEDVSDYIDSHLELGEEVAFICHSRKDAATMRDALEEAYPQQKVAYLVPQRFAPISAFSTYVNRYWNDVKQVDPLNAAFTIHSQMNQLADKLVSGHQAEYKSEQVREQVTEWWLSYAYDINTWTENYKAGSLTAEKFLDRLQNTLITYEIKKNNMRNTVVSSANQAAKEMSLKDGPKLIVSTIHSVKGLEFDNCVVVLKHEDPMEEDAKRMYYVALTRAKKSLYVLAYGKDDKPDIVEDYESIIKSLMSGDASVRENLEGHYDATDDDAAHHLSVVSAEGTVR